MSRQGRLSVRFAIVENPLLPEFKKVPVKSLERKRWMGDNYYKRVQKKWLKRFGYKEELCFLISGTTIFAHPNNAERVRSAILS